MVRKIKGFLLLVALLAPSLLPAQELPDTILSRPIAELRDVTYGVRPGDEVTIRVFSSAGEELQVVSGVRVVDPSGQIYLPFVGTLNVAGMAAPEIRDRLEEAYSILYTEPVVEVASRIRVNVTGSVRSPGHYLLDPSSSLIDALGHAGGVGSEIDIGFAAAADAANSRFVRGGNLYVLDLRPDTQDPSIFTLPVQSGDWIHVPIAPRSRVREQVQFWGGVIGLVASTVSLAILLGR